MRRNYVPVSYETRECLVCRTEFTKRKGARFCSKKCYKVFARPPIEKRRIAYEKWASKSPREFMSRLLYKRKKKVTREELTLDILCDVYDKQKGLCALSGLPMTYKLNHGVIDTNISLDRKDQTQGYTPENIQLVCMAANVMKWVNTEERMRFWCERILNNGA